MKQQAVGLLFIAMFVMMGTHLSAEESTLVSVAGRQVEVVQMGEGSPILVVENSGVDAAQWSRLLPELAKLTRVISYSRAGFGSSTASTIPGSPQLSVAELHELLEALGAKGPFVLAGHSWGALLARLYVSTYPSDVAGLILIDGTHEAQCARWKMVNPSYKCAEEFRAAVSNGPLPLRDLIDQLIDVESTQRVDGMKPLPNVPLAVITAAKSCPPTEDWACRDAMAMAVRRELHDEWAARSTSSLRIVSSKTGHNVMNDQPVLIVDAVEFVLDQLKPP